MSIKPLTKMFEFRTLPNARVSHYFCWAFYVGSTWLMRTWHISKWVHDCHVAIKWWLDSSGVNSMFEHPLPKIKLNVKWFHSYPHVVTRTNDLDFEYWVLKHWTYIYIYTYIYLTRSKCSGKYKLSSKLSNQEIGRPSNLLDKIVT